MQIHLQHNAGDPPKIPNYNFEKRVQLIDIKI